MRTLFLTTCLLVLVAACRSESRDARSTAPARDTAAARTPAATDPIAAAAPADTSASSAPAPASAADSARLALRGQSLFQSKRCTRCHSIGEGYQDGPDLAGVTERRSFQQITMLLTDTEEAIQTDPDFQQLRIEHFLDMPNLNLSRADALALYYYLRAQSQRVR